MSVLQLVLVLDGVVLVAVAVASTLAEAANARVRRRAAATDWALLRSWLDAAPTR